MTAINKKIIQLQGKKHQRVAGSEDDKKWLLSTVDHTRQKPFYIIFQVQLIFADFSAEEKLYRVRSVSGYFSI